MIGKRSVVSDANKMMSYRRNANEPVAEITDLSLQHFAKAKLQTSPWRHVP